MPIGIPGSFEQDRNTMMLDMLRQQKEPENQNSVQIKSVNSSAEQLEQSNEENRQRLSMESNLLDSAANKHSRNLIDIFA
jgi:hypothetical protein